MAENSQEMQSLQEIADRLLWPLWLGIPKEYKQKYLRNIWQQFESNIRSAAYTDTLVKFYEKIKRRLGIEIIRKNGADVLNFLKASNAKETLQALRSETAILVLMVQNRNNERKEQYEKNKSNKIDWMKDEQEWLV